MFADDLAAALSKQKMSIPTLAARTGLSLKHVYNLLDGSRKPSPRTLAQLDRLLGFPTRVLIHFIRIECANREPPTAPGLRLVARL